MSTTDKTRQQLVDSMRETKAAAASKKTAGNKTPRPATRAAKTTKKAASPASSAKVEAGSGTETPDPYRVGRRVWPD